MPPPLPIPPASPGVEGLVADVDGTELGAVDVTAHAHSLALRLASSDWDAFRDAGGATTAERVARGARLRAALHDEGWARRGWPAAAGGLGGGALHRAVLHDELERAGVPVPEQDILLEVVGPTLCRYAPALADRFLPGALRGDDVWCQGFSEPEAGSDLAGLRCRAVAGADGGWTVNGQKTWTTLGAQADRILLLARTGTPESRHRGLSLFLVDLDTPGVEARPIRFANGRDEVAEVFLTDVAVPADRVVGEPDQGWAVAMHLLQYERGMYAWMRQAALHRRVRELAAQTVADGADPAGVTSAATERLGAAYLAVAAVRARSRATVAALHRGDTVGPEASADKVLLAAAEHAVHDAARRRSASRFALDPAGEDERADWFYSRAATIYGGSAEVQRDILADRVLALPRVAR